MIQQGTVSGLACGLYYAVPTYIVGSPDQLFHRLMWAPLHATSCKSNYNMSNADTVAAKQSLRRVMLQRRSTILKDERLNAAQQLLLHLEAIYSLISTAVPSMRSVEGVIIAGYWAIGSELDIKPLLAKLEMAGAVLCLPAVINRHDMVFRAFSCDKQKDLRSMIFGTIGPDAEAAELVPQVVLLPLLAFDKTGARLGYGGGFYDKYIASMETKPLLIGVSFASQEVEAVDTEIHDKQLDAILTPEYFVRF